MHDFKHAEWSLGALRIPLCSLSLSNRVLTCGQKSFELSPSKRHLNIDLMNSLKAELRSRTLYHILLSPWGAESRRKIKGTAGGAALEIHLSPWEMWEFIRALANSVPLWEKPLSCHLKYLLALHHPDLSVQRERWWNWKWNLLL